MSCRKIRSSDLSKEIIESLPEDLLIDILLRMPAQRVVVFRSLSKYYKDLIDSDEFTRKHHEVLMKTRPGLLLYRRVYGHQPVVIHLEFESGCQVDELVPPFKDEGGLEFLGCQRGILCYNVKVNADVDHLIFWNPITGVVRRSESADSISRLHAHESLDLRVRYSFGYDPVTDDFKVLKITRFCDELWKYVQDCVIYSSKMDSWTMMILENSIRVTWASNEAYVNNSVHTYATSTGHGRNCVEVLAFDFMAEKFNIFPSPPMPGPCRLSSVDGCLCSVSQCHRTRNFEGWIMKDYGVVESWAKLYAIQSDSFPSFLRLMMPLHVPVVIHGRLQLLIHYRSFLNGLHLYDVNRKQLNDAVLSDLDDVHIKQINQALKSYFIYHFLFVPSHRKP